MKNNILILCLFLVGLNGFGQSNTPVGKWKMIEHKVSDKLNKKTNVWTTKNIYQNEFDNIITFNKDGSFTKLLGDSLVTGHWKLSSNGKIFKINCTAFKYKSKTKKEKILVSLFTWKKI